MMFSFIKHLFKPQFFIILLSVIAGVYYPQLLDHIKEKFGFAEKSIKLIPASVTQTSNSEILFTKQTLSEFNGEDVNKDIYLGILGSVYDVSRGKKFYGGGCTYSMFAGKDASALFISGDFTEYNENSDDVLKLSLSDLLSLFNWKKFYEKEYIYKGKLIGRFYDKNGEMTKYHHKVIQMVKIAEQEKAEQEKLKEIYPPCNIEWSAEKGTKVWCTPNSGGLDRGWTGVPRKLYEPGQTSYRCACIKENEIDSPKLKIYENCLPLSTECFYKLD